MTALAAAPTQGRRKRGIFIRFKYEADVDRIHISGEYATFLASLCRMKPDRKTICLQGFIVWHMLDGFMEFAVVIGESKIVSKAVIDFFRVMNYFAS